MKMLISFPHDAKCCYIKHNPLNANLYCYFLAFICFSIGVCVNKSINIALIATREKKTVKNMFRNAIYELLLLHQINVVTTA